MGKELGEIYFSMSNQRKGKERIRDGKERVALVNENIFRIRQRKRIKSALSNEFGEGPDRFKHCFRFADASRL